MISKRKNWVEQHTNGLPWVTGEIGIIEKDFHLYDYRTHFPGYEGVAVCRLGVWKKYYDNGQEAWTIEYDDFGKQVKNTTPSYRRDGSIVER